MKRRGPCLFIIGAQIIFFNPTQASEPDALFRLDFDSGFTATAVGRPEPTNARRHPLLVEGIKGKAALFGPGQVLRYLSHENLNKDRGTLSLWVKAPVDGIGAAQANGRHTLFREDGPYTSPATNAMWAWLNEGKGYRFDLRDPGDRYVYFQAARPWKRGEWHHLAFTWDSRRGSEVYADGKLIAISTPVIWMPKLYPAFFIGAADEEGLDSWGSAVDEIGIFGRVLTGDEIRAEYLRLGRHLPESSSPASSLPVEVARDFAWPPLARLDPPAGSEKGVRQVTYRKWPGSYRISNDSIDLVVVPAVGRIMHYGLVDGGNLLWENPALSSDDGKGKWMNAGGDKIWPWPQDAWTRPGQRAFRPPVEWDSLPHTVEVTGPYSLRMLSPRWRGLRVVREIALDESGSRVRITSSIEANDHAAMANAPIVAPWMVTQVPEGSAVLFHARPENPRHELPFAGASWATAIYPGEEICVLPKPPSITKIFASGRTLGWWRDNLLFIQQLVAPPKEEDRAWLPYEQLQVYWETEPLNATTPYIELEFTAPRGRKASASLSVSWELKRFAVPYPSREEVVELFKSYSMPLAQKHRSLKSPTESSAVFHAEAFHPRGGPHR